MSVGCFGAVVYFLNNHNHLWWPVYFAFVFILIIPTSLKFQQKLFWVYFEDSIRIKELFIWHYSTKSPITFLKGSLHNRTAGSLKTAEGRGARLCIPILTRHLFVILPSWAFQPSCCVSSLFMATLHDQNARWTSPTMHWNKVIQNEASSYPPYWIFV